MRPKTEQPLTERERNLKIRKYIPKLRDKLLIMGFVLILMLFFHYQGNSLSVTTIYVQDAALPASLENYRIVQLSDMHSKMFGKEGNRLVEKVRRLEADLIVFTGDILDGKAGIPRDFDAWVARMAVLAPCCYSLGESENNLSEAERKHLLELLKRHNISLLDNQRTVFEKGEAVLSVTGLTPAGLLRDEVETAAKEALANIYREKGKPPGYALLLAHVPDPLELYAEYGYRLVLSGHVHGGQVRLPIIGGLLSTDLVPFPAYDAGYFQSRMRSTMLIVSRGLGNNPMSIRLLNRPEVMLVVLRSPAGE